MRVYIAGPINGMPNLNRDMFIEATNRLTAMGHEPVNPQDIGPVPDPHECLGDEIPHAPHRYGCYMVPDLHALLDCDGYTLLPNWHRSKGASVEYKVAVICGKTYVKTFQVGAIR